jgi:hypothetical protein
MLRLSLRDLRAHLGRYVLTFLAVGGVVRLGAGAGAGRRRFWVFAVPTLQLAAFAAATGVLTLAAAVVPAAWAGRRRILAAVADR